MEIRKSLAALATIASIVATGSPSNTTGNLSEQPHAVKNMNAGIIDCPVEIHSGFNLQDGNYTIEKIKIEGIDINLVYDNQTDQNSVGENIAGMKTIIQDLFHWQIEGQRIVEIFPQIKDILNKTPIIIREGGLFDEISFSSYCLDDDEIKRFAAINSRILKNPDITSLTSFLEEILHIDQRMRTERLYQDIQSSLASERGVGYDQVTIPGRSDLNELFHHTRMGLISTFQNDLQGETFEGLIEGGAALSRFVIQSMTRLGQQFVFNKQKEGIATLWINSGRSANPYGDGMVLGLLLRQAYPNSSLKELLDLIEQNEINMHQYLINNLPSDYLVLRNQSFSNFHVSFLMNESIMKAFIKGVALRYMGQDVGGAGDSKWPMEFKFNLDPNSLQPIPFSVSSGINYVSDVGGYVAYYLKGQSEPTLTRIQANVPFVLGEYDRFAIFYPDEISDFQDVIEINVTPLQPYYTNDKAIENIGLTKNDFNQILQEQLDTDYAIIAQQIYSAGGIVIKDSDLSDFEDDMTINYMMNFDSIGFEVNSVNYRVVVFDSDNLTRILRLNIPISAFTITHGVSRFGMNKNHIPNDIRVPLSPYYQEENLTPLQHWAYSQIPPINSVEEISDLEEILNENMRYLRETQTQVATIHFSHLDYNNATTIQVYSVGLYRIIVKINGRESIYENITDISEVFKILSEVGFMKVLSIGYLNFIDNQWLYVGSIHKIGNNSYYWNFQNFPDSKNNTPSQKRISPMPQSRLKENKLKISYSIPGFAKEGEVVEVIERRGYTAQVKNSKGTVRWIKLDPVLVMPFAVPETLKGYTEA